MRVLIVAGSFPPVPCGVGDYIAKLVSSLAKNHEIILGVLAQTNTPAIRPNSASVFFERKTITLYNTIKIIGEFKPDIIHIQYPTSRSLPKLLPVLIRTIFHIPIVQTWHEYYNKYNPFELYKLMGLDALIYVREDLQKRFPVWLKLFTRKIIKCHIPVAATIPIAHLTKKARLAAAKKISKNKTIVVFFGFINPNKGVDRLFKILDPKIHHLLIIGDISNLTTYRKKIIKIASSKIWRDSVTFTGHIPPENVGKLLATAAAVVFPFPNGTGHWNTSLHAALESGTVAIATTADASKVGYDPKKNICLVPCNDIDQFRSSLLTYIGKRRRIICSNYWDEIADNHVKLYKKLILD